MRDSFASDDPTKTMPSTAGGRAKWLPPITEETRRPHACLNCEAHGAIPITFRDNDEIAVGFGYAGVTKDGQEVYSEPQLRFDENDKPIDVEGEYMTGAQALALANAEPDRDWRIMLHGPLSGRTYQYQGAAGFVLVEQDEGFA